MVGRYCMEEIKMTCPKCGYKQYCPCRTCAHRIPTGMKPQIEKENDYFACANCGLEMHVDAQEEISMREYDAKKALEVEE